MRKYNLFTWLIIVFFSIGFITSLLANPSGILVPLLIFGAIFYFLKHPEKLRGRGNGNSYGTNKQSNRYNKRKDVSFKVIDGKFKDVENDKDNPKYH